MNIIDMEVRHTVFGIGNITRQAEGFIWIRFNDSSSERQFVFPDAFNKFLSTTNSILDDLVAVLLKQKSVYMLQQQLAEAHRMEEHKRQLLLSQPVPQAHKPRKKKAAASDIETTS